jgi:hypothetical protein
MKVSELYEQLRELDENILSSASEVVRMAPFSKVEKVLKEYGVKFDRTNSGLSFTITNDLHIVPFTINDLGYDVYLLADRGRKLDLFVSESG